MADAVSFDSLLNTTTGMTTVVNNVKHDDDVVSVTGVDWFTYAGKTASTIYVSGNNFIGFGQKAEQLKIRHIKNTCFVGVFFVVPVCNLVLPLCFVD